MRLDKKFAFVSNAEPAAKHDLERLQEVQQHILQNLGQNEGIVLDKGFVGFVPVEPRGQWLIMHKRPKHGELSVDEKKRNKEISLVRKPIEKELGDINSRFEIFAVKYRHNREWFTTLLRFGVAVHNLIVDFFANPRRFCQEWNGPVYEGGREINNESQVHPYE
jgi:hypothetical protein